MNRPHSISALFLAAVLVTVFGLGILWQGQQARSAATDPAQSASGSRASGSTTVVYTPAVGHVPNPERGFYRYIETRASAPSAYDAGLLTGYVNDGVRLLYCIHYLDTFVSQPISQAFLDHIQANLNTVRSAGLKCMLRFAYTDDDPTVRGEEPPFGDASKEQIEAHLQQLQPLLQANADVIALVQAGFIGVWGEWYYTDHFVDDPETPWIVSRAQYARRLQVLTGLLNSLPISRTSAVRYPFAVQAMFGTEQPIGAAEAHKGSLRARTGFHNDCFLASETDFGTYRQGSIETDKNYLAASTRYVPMGGETCNPNPPRSNCPTALAELERFHFSYLNREYHPDILTSWQNQGCFAEIQQRLGYRLVLKQGTFAASARAGNALQVNLELDNQGYAAPFSPRPVALVLRNTTTGMTRTLPLNVDPRFWLPGTTHTIEETLVLPPDLPAGDYRLLLHLPDESAALRQRPAYAIQFANQGVWEPATGYNDLLHTVRLEPASATPTATSTRTVTPAPTGTPTPTATVSASGKLYLPSLRNR